MIRPDEPSLKPRSRAAASGAAALAEPNDRSRDGGPTRMSNRAIMLSCVAFFGCMVGMAYASVPLYRLFCQITGYGGTTQRVVEEAETVLDRTIKVRFDANVSGLPWAFAPKQREVELRIGETIEVAYGAENLGSVTTAGTASFNVTPQAAGAYFNKMQCFCFTEQRLAPGENVHMPVLFYVDPAIVEAAETRGIETLTLSYTFFPDPDADLSVPLEAAGADTRDANASAIARSVDAPTLLAANAD